MLSIKSNYPIPLSSWIDAESTNTFFSDLENEYKLLGTKSKIPKKHLFSTPSKKDTMIEKFRNVKKIKWNKKIKIIKKTRNKWNKNGTRRKLNILDDEISNILEKLDVNLTTLKLRCKFCKNPYDFKKERELRLSAEEKINEIERLKEKAENNRDKSVDYLLFGENNLSKLLVDLQYERQKNIP